MKFFQLPTAHATYVAYTAHAPYAVHVTDTAYATHTTHTAPTAHAAYTRILFVSFSSYNIQSTYYNLYAQ